jgi:hypothetical protein
MMFTGQLFWVSTSTGLARRVAQRRVSQVLLALLSLSTVTETASYAATIQSLRGERRIVLYSAPNDHDDRLIRQQDVLAKWLSAAERDVTGIQIVGNSVRGADDSAADLRQRYHLPNDRFSVVLIGKDGHVALSSAAVLTSAQLESVIDAMPMRRAGER